MMLRVVQSSAQMLPLVGALLFVACGGGGSQAESQGTEGADSDGEMAGEEDSRDGSGEQDPSADDTGGSGSEVSSEQGSDDGAESNAGGEETEREVEMLEPDPSVYAVFTEPFSGFTTTRVYDAEREVFLFDAEVPAMVNEANGARASQWLVQGNELGAGGNFGTFMVRFGVEEGEQRAYFTEVGAGTICNLELSQDERLSIFATSEPPPSE